MPHSAFASIARRARLAAILAIASMALPRAAHAQTCTTISPPCPSNEPPRVVIGPTVNPDTTSASVAVTVAISDDRFMSGSPSFSPSLSGLAWTWTANNTSATYTGTLSLSSGWNTLIVSITDDDGATGADTVVLYSNAPSSPPAQGAPILFRSPHSSTVRSVAGCSGCLYGGASYTTPAYVSRDVPRGVSLVYSSAQAVPRGLVRADAIVNTSTTPSNLSMRLVQGGSAVNLTNGGTQAWYTGTTGAVSVGAQVDASATSTGVLRYTAEVNAHWGGSTYSSTWPVRVLIINEAASPFGAGWSIAGLQKLTLVGDSAVIADGSGDITFYRRTSSTTFATDSGAIAALTVASGEYTLTGSDGSWVRFNSSGQMRATGNRFNDSTVYAYSGTKISSITDEAGKSTTFTYAPDGICPGGATSGTLCAITTPGGRVSKFVVDGSNDLVTIIDPDGVTAFTGSYTSHKLTSSTDRLGSTTTLAYDSFTGLASVTSQSVTTTTTGGSGATESPVTTYQSIEAALLSTSNTSSGSARAYVTLGADVAKVTAPNGTAVEMRLQGAGEPRSTEVKPVSGPSRRTDIEYNGNFLPVSVTGSPVGGTTTYEWGGRDTLRAVVDPSGARTQIFTTSYLLPDSVRVNGATLERNVYGTHAGFLNLSSSTRGSAQTTFTWDAHGRMTQVSAAGSTTNISYAGSGFQNRSQVTTGSSATTFTQDAYGRDSVISNPLGQATTTAYDVLNRVSSATQPGSAVTSVSVSENTSAHTSTVTVTDPRSLVFSSVGNALGWTTSVTDPHSNAASAGYDRNGFLRRAVNRASGVVTASYDSLGRPVSVVANGNTTSFSYDAVTSPSSPHWTVGVSTDSRDSVNTDGQGRPTVASTTRGSMVFTLTNTYNAQGDRNLLKVSNGTWTDSLQFATDAHSFPYQLPDFGHQWTRVHYTSQRLIDTIEFRTGSGGTLLRLLPTSYTSFLRPQQVTVKAGGVLKDQWNYAYDGLGRLSSTDSGNVHDYYRREFSYDARGRLASYADKRYFVSDSTQEACPPPEIFCDPPPPWDYTWSTTTIRSVTFNPDNSGNRTDGSASLSNDRLSSMTDPYTSTSYSFSYDAEGRRTAKTASGYAQTYGWNDLGQLTWVKTNGDSVAFGYDAAGRRVRKYRSSTGATAHYLWDADNLLMELDGSGNRVRQYAYQAAIDRPVSVTISGTTYNYQLDEAGNVIALWNASNAKVATYTDDPYGYPVATSGSVTQPLRWKGREYDSETGLYYIRARYYDPTVGRFLSEDPIGLEGGINPYTFADGEPVNRADPSGLEWICNDDYKGGKKIGNPACTFQLDPMVITAPYNWIGFRSSRGGSSRGIGGFPNGGGGFVGASVGPSSGGVQVATWGQIHRQAFSCGMASANLTFGAVTDVAVLAGVGIGVKAAVNGGRSIFSGILDRWVVEELNARYLVGSRPITLRQLGKSSAAGITGTGMYVANESSPGLSSYAQGFVPLATFAKNYTHAQRACGF